MRSDLLLLDDVQIMEIKNILVHWQKAALMYWIMPFSHSCRLTTEITFIVSPCVMAVCEPRAF